MHTPPRIEFSTFRSDNDPMLAAWRRFRSRLAVVTATDLVAAPSRRAVASAESGIWRLLASNNREVARSAWAYHGFSAARAHVIQVQQRADELSTLVVPGPADDSYGWVMELAGNPVVTCSRWYGSTSSCVESAGSARSLLATATLGETSRTWSTGSRRGGRISVGATIPF